MLQNRFDQLWEQQIPQHQKLIKNGAKAFFSGIPGIERAWKYPSERVAACVDSRLPSNATCHFVGAGTLRELDGLIAQYVAAKISAVWMHEQCAGAARAAIGTGMSADEYAEHFGQRIEQRAAELGHKIRYAGMIPRTNFLDDLHRETVVYWKGMRRFCRRDIQDLPVGFHFDRKTSSSEESRNELQILLDLAFSDTGFDGRFTPEMPLVIIVLGHPYKQNGSLSFDTLQTEVAEFLTDSPAYRDGRVRIDGFDVPEQWMDQSRWNN